MSKPRNLFLFTDGTGNAGGKSRNTNVYRLFQAIERYEPNGEDDPKVGQLTFYDDGVGTSDNALSRAIGGAFGWGLTRNIIELYEWLVLNYRSGDRIFVFGFSRGGFTARCLAGLVRRCGLMKREAYLALPAQRRRGRLRNAVKAYRAVGDRRFRRWRGDSSDYRPVRIYLLGVWDTVDAVGMPADELRWLLDRATRWFMGRRAYAFDDQELAGVEHARQAIAIDDERRTFHPNVWHKNPEKPEHRRVTEPERADRATDPANIRQVWFAGAHSNVGGGYPKDQLALVALDWMMGELEELAEIDRKSGIPEPQRVQVRFLPGQRGQVQGEADAQGRQYDPRTGPAVYYRYSPRRITRFYKGTDDFWARCRQLILRLPHAPLPKHGIEIHASVLDRIERGTQAYAPLFLPDRGDTRFKLTTNFTFGEPSDYSKERCGERLANRAEWTTDIVKRNRGRLSRLVIAGQFVYAALFVSTVLALLTGLRADVPQFADTAEARLLVLPSVECWGLSIPELTLGHLATLAKGLIPDLLSNLVDAAFAHPRTAAAYLGSIALAFVARRLLNRKIGTIARGMYESLA